MPQDPGPRPLYSSSPACVETSVPLVTPAKLRSATLGQPSALPTPTLWWMGRRTRVPRCWLSNHSYLSREITAPRFALNPLEVGTGQSENPLRWTGSRGSDPPEACLQSVPSDPCLGAGRGETSSHTSENSKHAFSRWHPPHGGLSPGRGELQYLS